jgi:hypothetical protein
MGAVDEAENATSAPRIALFMGLAGCVMVAGMGRQERRFAAL